MCEPLKIVQFNFLYLHLFLKAPIPSMLHITSRVGSNFLLIIAHSQQLSKGIYAISTKFLGVSLPKRVSRLLTVESALWHFPYPAPKKAKSARLATLKSGLTNCQTAYLYNLYGYPPKPCPFFVVIFFINTRKTRRKRSRARNQRCLRLIKSRIS